MEQGAFVLLEVRRTAGRVCVLGRACMRACVHACAVGVLGIKVSCANTPLHSSEARMLRDSPAWITSAHSNRLRNREYILRRSDVFRHTSEV